VLIFLIAINALLMYGRVSEHVDAKCRVCMESRHFGPKTFRHHQTGAEVSRQFSTSAKCLADTSALVPNCLNLQQTFFAATGRFNIARYNYYRGPL